MPLVALQGKVSPEVLEQFKAAQENNEKMTFNGFIEDLLEAYLNPKTRTVEVSRPTADQLQEIQLKDNEIGRWKQAHQLEQQRAAELETLNAQLETRNAILEESHNQNPEPGNPEPGTIQLTIPPIISAAIEAEQQAAKKKSGKDFSIGDILINNFWESIVNGRSYPFRVWSSAELANLAKKVKEAQQ